MLKSVDKIKSSVGSRIGRGCRWKGTIVGKEVDGFGNSFSACFWNVDAVARVVLGSSAKIPSVNAVKSPGAADSRGFVDKDFGAWWRKRCSIVVEGAVELRLPQKFGVDLRGLQKIESSSGVLDETTPEVESERWIGTTETGNEVVLPSANRFLGGVGAMKVGRNKLEINACGMHKCF
jgi:hypothetical protein